MGRVTGIRYVITVECVSVTRYINALECTNSLECMNALKFLGILQCVSVKWNVPTPLPTRLLLI